MFCRNMNITQIFSSPFQHQSNGLVERQIRTIRDMLYAEKHESKSNWKDKVPKVEFVINATKQDTTGFSPFEIIFNKKIIIHGNNTKLNSEDIQKEVLQNSRKF